jgi:hypothetical protein
MANLEKTPVTIQELVVSSLASTDALAKLLIEKGFITEHEFLEKISEERAIYQRMLQSYGAMTIGLLLWESLTVVIVVLGALGIFLLRSWFPRTDGEIRWALWLRFSALLFGVQE